MNSILTCQTVYQSITFDYPFLELTINHSLVLYEVFIYSSFIWSMTVIIKSSISLLHSNDPTISKKQVLGAFPCLWLKELHLVPDSAGWGHSFSLSIYCMSCWSCFPSPIKGEIVALLEQNRLNPSISDLTGQLRVFRCPHVEWVA